jgi:hypothetical protein
MVATANPDRVRWLAPSPFWNTRAGDAIGRPRILRFTSDSFMDQFLALMRYDPQRLEEWLAEPETWRLPLPQPASAKALAVAQPVSELRRRVLKRSNGGDTPPGPRQGDGAEALELKLFQPAQQRFYLVSAALVCDRPGLPYRVVDSARQERAGFVLRRVPAAGAPADPQAAHEYAFVQTAQGFQWQPLTRAQAETLVADEERLGLFNLDYQDEGGRKRRLHAGLIPVSRREAYHAAPLAAEALEAPGTDGQYQVEMSPIKALVLSEVVAPWQGLLEQAVANKGRLNASRAAFAGDADAARELKGNEIALIQAARNQTQTGAWYVLLDLARILDRYLPDVLAVLRGTLQRADLGSDEERAVYDWIDRAPDLAAGLATDLVATSGGGYQAGDIASSLADALALVSSQPLPPQDAPETLLERVDSNYDRDSAASRPLWPGFLFPLTDSAHRFGIDAGNGAVPGPNETPVGETVTFGAIPLGVPAGTAEGATTIAVDPDLLVDWSDALDVRLAALASLAGRIARAVEAVDPAGETVPPEIPLVEQRGTALTDYGFVVRCVYEQPNCGPLHPPVVSAPSRAFRMASFFDPDAPARPIRIPMPLDITPAGLRKFNKNAGFALSNLFCGQLKRMRGMSFGDLVLSVLPWPFHKDLPDPGSTGPCEKGGSGFGMICSLSIPIVSVCAFILLLIMVLLFDMFFRWIPYLFTCLPIPGLSGKKP